MMKRLVGKVAIITGAGNGQGAFEAKLFAEHGAKIIVTDINIEGANKTVREIKDKGGEAFAVYHDVSSKEQWQKVAKESIANFGKVDILVNNAGVDQAKTIEEITEEDWDRILNVNLKGVFLGIQAIAPLMQKNGLGSIINIASVAALIGGTGSFAHYSSSKGGVRSLSKVAALDYAKDNIRVNSVYPGFILTDLTKEVLKDEKVLKIIKDKNPLPRFGEVQDVAYGVLYLASDESGFVTGNELIIDGGTISH